VGFGTLVIFIDLVDHVACGEDFEAAENDHAGMMGGRAEGRKRRAGWIGCVCWPERL
jgi:hypothetical protein